MRAAIAAANGARLIETWRINTFRQALDIGWDILVLQDFSTTCLRASDRWASGWAMRAMATRARARAVLLYPTWAFPPDHDLYHRRAGLLSVTPRTPDDFASRITAHYEDIARAEGWTRAPVTEMLRPDAHLKNDLHHLNPKGAVFVANILWNSLRDMDQVSRIFTPAAIPGQKSSLQ